MDYMDNVELCEKVYNCISVQGKAISLNKLAKKLSMDPDEIKDAIDELRINRRILLSGNKLSLFPNDNYIGTVCLSLSGNKFIFDDYGVRIPVSIDCSETLALDDVVSYRINDHKEAEITSIIKRDIDVMTCEVKIVNGKKKLIPYRIGIIPIIDSKIMKELNDGDIIKVKNTIVDEYGYANCEYISKLGNIRDSSLVEKIILENNGIPTGYSEEYMKELEQIPEKIRKKDYPDRVDDTDIPFTTIDCDDTMDIDDGLYGYKKENGLIHIKTILVDMPELVDPDSEIFKRAYGKQFTTYFQDSCDPLFHPKISNNIGSLNQGQLRLTTTVSYDIDKNGEVLNPDFKISLCASRMKMSYSNVNKVLDKDTMSPGDYKKYEETLKVLYEAAMRFKDYSSRQGRIDLLSSDISLVKDACDKNNIFERREATPADELVEFLMIPTNIALIKYFHNKGIYLLPYRNHDKINISLLNNLIGNYNDRVRRNNDEIRKLRKNGWKKKLNDGTVIEVQKREPEKYLPVISTKNAKKEIQFYSKKLESDPKLKEIFDNYLKISIPRAYYSTECIGHDALALLAYVQTTAQIRRLLDGYFTYLEKQLLKDPNWYEKNYIRLNEILNDACEKATVMERRTDNAERDGNIYKLLTEIEPYIGEEFTGTIASLSPDKIKVKFNELYTYVDYNCLDENFEFDNARKLFYDKNNGKYFKEGETIIFTLTKINISNLTFNIIINGIQSQKVLERA